MDNKYNGWTNYATWRVNLEMIDGIDFSDIACPGDDEYQVAQNLRKYAEEIVTMSVQDPECGIGQHSPNLAKDYALAFLSDVDWRQIAQHMIANYAEA